MSCFVVGWLLSLSLFVGGCDVVVCCLLCFVVDVCVGLGLLAVAVVSNAVCYCCCVLLISRLLCVVCLRLFVCLK